jgi:hypothetical protein
VILSHSRKFIFIKTRKVSGTSMEISLSQACSGDDILTPISYEDELIRSDLGGCLPQNYGDKNEEHFRELIRTRNPAIGRVKHKYRSDRRPASELLNAEQKVLIYRNCQVEFDTLGFNH